jgi:hypothetical protein
MIFIEIWIAQPHQLGHTGFQRAITLISGIRNFKLHLISYDEPTNRIKEDSPRTSKPTKLSRVQRLSTTNLPPIPSLLIKHPKHHPALLLDEPNSQAPKESLEIQKPLQAAIQRMEPSHVLHLHIPAHRLDVYPNDCTKEYFCGI